MLNRRVFLAGLAAASGIAVAPAARAAGQLTIFAAASLKTALDGVVKAWAARGDGEAAVSYAASSALARQIEQGAPADLFISADLDWMAYLAERRLVAATQVNLLGNSIVLIAPADSPVTAEIAPGFPLAELLGTGRLAMADVAAVPAGRYGKAALETLGVWPLVKDRLAQAENVRAALKLVATGEAPLGIVYRTDAMAEPAVRVVATFPAATHPEIVYPAARVAASANPDADRFLAFLQGPEAQAIFIARGFDSLVPPASN